MAISLTSVGSTNCRCDSSGLGYFVGGSKYAGFCGIPFKNTDKGTIILKSLTLPLAYWSESPSPRTVIGAVWLASNNPNVGSEYNVMDLKESAISNLGYLRNSNGGNVNKNTGYKYWHSPWYGLGSSDRSSVLNAMIYSTNTCTPNEEVLYSNTNRVKEYTFNFNNIQIPSGTLFYVGIYADESESTGTSIAIRRLGYSSTDRNGSTDKKYSYDDGTMVACNYVNYYRGRWHFYHDYFTNTGSENNYAHGCVDASILVESVYGKPTISITSTGTATKANSNVTISYSANTATNQGTTYVQYSINGKAWITVEGSSNSAGSFTYNPSSSGIQAGNAGYTVKVRRVSSSTNIDNISSESSITMKTYNTVTLTNLKSSVVSPINANISTTLTWDKWNTSWDESSTCKVEVIRNGSVISTISSSLASGTNTVTFTPSSYIGVSYDNLDLSLRVIRTSSSSGDTASYAIPYKILYKPTKTVVNLTPSVGVVAIDKKITWSYPSGQNGIVSGYQVLLTGTNGHTKTYEVSTNSCTIKVSDLNPARYYSVKIRAFYKTESTYYYGDYCQEQTNYIKYDAGISTPSITYPINGCKWTGNTYRVVFKLPTDGNYQYLSEQEKNSYRYHDVEVIINDKIYSITSYPSAFSLTAQNLTHESFIVFSPAIIGISSANTNSVKVRVKSYFDSWSNYSNTVQITNSSVSFSKSAGDIIKADDYLSIFNHIASMCKAYGISTTTHVDIGEKILSSDINNMNSYLVNIVTKVNTTYTYNNAGVKFKTPTQIAVSTGNKIYASDFAGIVSMISTISS